MINSVKSRGKIKEKEQGKVALRLSSDEVIGHFSKGCFSGVGSSKTRLEGVKERVGVQVMGESFVDKAFKEFGDIWEKGDRAVVGG
uniref:Uncharacterized protein n=1 Tax=Pyxicephalus adspersus TaxID=30357 RepID=A0AAV3ABV7_PYXAD|nr:TPA: hypothetical protein GDO54_013935 [Pyxicephalus adspersus]